MGRGIFVDLKKMFLITLKKGLCRLENERICANDHRYFKSSDCPVCPKYDNAQKQTDGFMVGLEKRWPLL